MMRSGSFVALPDAQAFSIRGARVPGRLLRDIPPGAVADAEGSVLIDFRVEKGRLTAIAAAGQAVAGGLPCLELGGRQLWPTLVDLHTHIDKSQVIGRMGRLGASFASAREAIVKDRQRYWSHEDIRARMEFSVRCAYVNGTAALRSHIDSYEGQAELSWSVFAEVRAAWQGRVVLQATSSVPIDVYATDYGRRLADLAAATEGGLLGGVLRRSTDHNYGHMDNIAELLDAQFTLAKVRGLAVDLHVDETLIAADSHLDEVARAVMRHGLEGRVVCGHLCSLAAQPDDKIAASLALCAEAGIGVVSLPTSNLYMHDRTPGRTPRLRGVTLAQEMLTRNIPFAIASDNVRDAFIPFGDYDLFDLFRQSIGVYHLDHCLGEAVSMVGPAPARMMGVEPIGSLCVGGPANLIIFNARSINELVCRPQADRVVVNAGRPVTDALPAYADLDVS